MKRNDVYNRAEEFFRANINSELRSDADWECWETGALAVIAVYLQQDLKSISFRQIYNHCQYRELVRLAELLTWSGTDDDVQTLLHVCRNRTAHKKFFSVVKTCFENKTGNIPFFGKINESNNQKEDSEKVDLAKIELEAEHKGWHIGYDCAAKFFKKRIYKCGAVGFFAGAVVGVMWTAEYFTKF